MNENYNEQNNNEEMENNLSEPISNSFVENLASNPALIQITNEINKYRSVAKLSIFEMGKLLKEVKENMLEQNEWYDYCKEIVMISPTHANNYIRVFEEFGDDEEKKKLPLETLGNLVRLPVNERDKEHLIPSTGERKKIADMSRKEMREALKFINYTKDDERQLKTMIEEGLLEEISTSKNIEIKLISNKSKENEFQQLVFDLQRKIKINDAEKKVLENRLEQKEMDANEHRKLQKELELLQEQKSEFLQQLKNTAKLISFIDKINDVYINHLVPLSHYLKQNDMELNDVTEEELEKMFYNLKDWLEEIRTFLPNKINIRKNIN